MRVVFETPRLLLRQMTEADAKHILQLNSDPEVVRYVHEPVLTKEGQALSIIKDIILPQYDRGLGRWAMITKDHKDFIGWCGLKYRADRDEIDLGYRLKKEAWGKGFATEAAQQTLHYGLHTLALPLITGRAHVQNLASLRVLEKIGMIFQREETVDDCPVKTYTLGMQHS